MNTRLFFGLWPCIIFPTIFYASNAHGAIVVVDPNDPTYEVPDDYYSPTEGPNEGAGGSGDCNVVNCAYYGAGGTNTANCASGRFTNTCYVSGGQSFVVSSCSGCNSGYTLIPKSIYLSAGCGALTVNFCQKNETESDPDDVCSGACDDCVSSVKLEDGYYSEVTAECDTSTCTCIRRFGGYCVAGYYGKGTMVGIGEQRCHPCPDPGTSINGTTEITGCFIPTGSSGSDSTGNFIYDAPCKYVE